MLAGRGEGRAPARSPLPSSLDLGILDALPPMDNVLDLLVVNCLS